MQKRRPGFRNFLATACAGLLLLACAPPIEPPSHALVAVAERGFAALSPAGRVLLVNDLGEVQRTTLRADSLAADPSGTLYLGPNAYRWSDAGLQPIDAELPNVPAAQREQLSAWQGSLSRAPDDSAAGGRFLAMAVNDKRQIFVGGPGIYRMTSAADTVLVAPQVVYGLAFGADGLLYATRVEGRRGQLIRLERDGNWSLVADLMR